VEYRRLGRTGLAISTVGFGCAAIGGFDYGRVRDSDSIAAVHRALELGVNFFDTADVYGFGHSEEVLGKALSGRSKDAIVATKVGVAWDVRGRRRRDLSPTHIRKAIDKSLGRLRIDRIALYQIHWPDPLTPLSETVGALRECQRAGKVEAIGCCNVSLQAVEQLQAMCRIESVQLPYSLADRRYESEMEQCCQRHDMAVLCYSVLAQGLLTGKYNRTCLFQGTDLRRRSPIFDDEHLAGNLQLLEQLRVVGARHSRTVAQTAIRWALSQPAVACAITGAKHPRQVDENAGGAGWRLSAEDEAILARPLKV
jgi:aryl-alcohol dehydrogenase-like predicted oxidoreductase